MFLIVNYLIIFSFLFFVSSENSSLEHDKNKHNWGYENLNGPKQWGGVCQSGTKQSPINIKLGMVKIKNYPSFKFDESYHIKRRLSVKNNGHTIQASIHDNFTKPFFYGGGLNGKYVFEQLHFHWESEHEFEGKRADLEMHLVHFNEKYQNFSEAAIKQDGLAVFAVLFDINNETDNEIENFFDYLTKSIFQDQLAVPELPPIDNTFNNNNNIFKETTFSLRDFLPKETMRFFRYEGSLTTPGCDEVVQWTVFTNRFPISNKVVKTLRTIPDHHGNLLLHSYRPPQKLNGRNVYLQIQNFDEDAEDHSNNTGSINKRLSIYFVFACVFIHLKFII